MYVHPDHWELGPVVHLMDAAEARLRALGHSSAILWVFEDNPRARRSYQAAGWRTDGHRKQFELFETAHRKFDTRRRCERSRSLGARRAVFRIPRKTLRG